MADNIDNRGNHGTGACRGENNNGGPKTEAGMERAKSNLQPDPMANVTHGLYLSKPLAMPCRKCLAKEECPDYEEGAICRRAQAIQTAIAQEVFALPHIDPAIDGPLVSELSKIMAAVVMADEYFSRIGVLLPGSEAGLIEFMPGFKTRMELSARLEKLATTLSLTPLQRAKLAAKKAGPGSDLAAAHAALQAEAIDAEFEAEPAEVGEASPAGLKDDPGEASCAADRA